MPGRLRKFLRDNGLSISLAVLFAGFLAGQTLAGHRQYNQTQSEHHQPAIPYLHYLRTGAFIEATFENWESEFLQMALYVWFTGFLYQRGSAESKDPDKKEAVDEDPRLHRLEPRAPLPVRRGGWMLKVYQYSLLLAFLALFLLSFLLHLAGSTAETCREQRLHGEACSTALSQLGSSTFWFESLQNWQSEFLAIAAVVILSIFLRQRGSPESKPVHAAHADTGR
jgi:hypothetical protein